MQHYIGKFLRQFFFSIVAGSPRQWLSSGLLGFLWILNAAPGYKAILPYACIRIKIARRSHSSFRQPTSVQRNGRLWWTERFGHPRRLRSLPLYKLPKFSDSTQTRGIGVHCFSALPRVFGETVSCRMITINGMPLVASGVPYYITPETPHTDLMRWSSP